MPCNSLTCNEFLTTLYQATRGSRVRGPTVQPVKNVGWASYPEWTAVTSQACRSWWCSHPWGRVALGGSGCPGPVPACVSRTNGGRCGVWPPSSHRHGGQPASPPAAPCSNRDCGGPGHRIPYRTSPFVGGPPTPRPFTVHVPILLEAIEMGWIDTPPMAGQDASWQ